MEFYFLQQQTNPEDLPILPVDFIFMPYFYVKKPANSWEGVPNN